MKNTEAIFIRLIPFGLASTFLGVYAAFWTNQHRCSDLTLGFMWELVPVSAYVFMFAISIAVTDVFLKSKNEQVFSFVGVIGWAAIVHGCFLGPLAYMTFPSERFFRSGATCEYNGENYFSNVIATFLIVQFLAWFASLAGIAWFLSSRKVAN